MLAAGVRVLRSLVEGGRDGLRLESSHGSDSLRSIDARFGASARPSVSLVAIDNNVLNYLLEATHTGQIPAADPDVSEQQVANYRFAAVKKLTEAMRAANLPTDVFPELQLPGE